jgi:pimeloyl-ACP methyl ester carboxylesterase
MSILTAMFILSFLVYVLLQFFTLFLETRFRLTLFLLILQSVAGFGLGFNIILNNSSGSSIVAALVIAWSSLVLVVALIKIFFLPHLWVKPPKVITRQRVSVGIAHKEVVIETEDGVMIKGFHIHSHDTDSVVILSHGGFRSKNSFENLGLAQWLSYDFNVISFDTRGHFESGGKWTGDGKTVLDLKAVVSYAKEQGYARVGVFGRSLGGWSAFLYASACNEIDSLVVLAAPLTHIRSTPLVSKAEQLKSLPGRVIVRMLDGLRYEDYSDHMTQTPMEVSQKMMTPTFLIYGKEDPVVGLREEDVRRVYERIPGKKQVYIFDEVVHLPSSYHLGPIYLFARDWFLDTLVKEDE